MKHKIKLNSASIVLVCFNVMTLVIMGNNAVYGQQKVETNQDNSPYVTWVNQYPLEQQTTKKQTFFQSLYHLVIGKSGHIALARPVSILGNSPTDFFVLDQGNQMPLFKSKKGLSIPRALRKKENYFTSLVGACKFPGKGYLFTDSRLNKVFFVSENGKNQGTINDTMKLQQPTGVAFNNATKEIWVVETNKHRLVLMDGEGKFIKAIGSRGADTAQFNFPTSIWIDKNGDVFVVDALNFRVQIFDKTGKYLTNFGEAGDGSGYFSRPKGIATDEFGNIYVVDGQFHTVQVFDRAGRFLYRFGSQGKQKEEFWMPSGIYIDNENYIYVADTYNSRIQVFQLINGR